MSYPSDLSDGEWALLEPHFRPKDRRGNASKHPRKRVVDAILYLVEGGIKGRRRPKDFPPWQTGYDPFSRGNMAGVWEAALDEMNVRHRKKSIGRALPATPSATRQASRPRTPATRGALTAARS